MDRILELELRDLEQARADDSAAAEEAQDLAYRLDAKWEDWQEWQKADRRRRQRQAKRGLPLAVGNLGLVYVTSEVA